MKRHCHCKFEEKRKKLRAGKFGALGGCLVVLHLLYHVAECLILPVVLIGFHRNNAEATQIDEELLPETTFNAPRFTATESRLVQIDLFDSIKEYPLRY